MTQNRRATCALPGCELFPWSDKPFCSTHWLELPAIQRQRRLCWSPREWLSRSVELLQLRHESAKKVGGGPPRDGRG